jgi:hypothetical protein
MSGGKLQYNRFQIEEIIEDIQKAINDNNKPLYPEDSPYIWDLEENKRFFDEGGYRYPPETIEAFKQAINAIKKADIYIHRIDWLLSGDDGEENFHRKLKEELNEIENK